MSTIERTGDWVAVERMLAQAGDRLRTEVGRATDLNGRLIEAKMVGHFQAQDLGWRTLSARYLAQKIRRGLSEQTLIATSSLLQNIRYQRFEWFAGFVGINRNVRHSNGQSLVNIAAVHEYGSSDGRIPARPFVEPTLRETADQVARNYQAAVDRVFRR